MKNEKIATEIKEKMGIDGSVSGERDFRLSDFFFSKNSKKNPKEYGKGLIPDHKSPGVHSS